MPMGQGICTALASATTRRRRGLALTSPPPLTLALFVTLGAADRPDAPLGSVIDGYWMGLAKRSIQVA